MLKLGHGLSFEDLYRKPGLDRLDAAFLDKLGCRSQELRARLLAARAAPDAVSDLDESTLMIELAPALEAFVAELFGIESEAAALAKRHVDLSPLYEVKRQFVQRQAAKMIKPDQAAEFDGQALRGALAAILGEDFDELRFARKILEWQADREANA